MSKAITKFKDSKTSTNNYIVIGDTVNGKEITEIWCSSVGTPIFTIDGEHYSWKDFLKILPDGLPPATTEYVTEDWFSMSEEEYKIATSGL
tara:strand:+ start:897 stop:1169 length:273 start_codon:yes stop_codon:yes gene_type:complete